MKLAIATLVGALTFLGATSGQSAELRSSVAAVRARVAELAPSLHHANRAEAARAPDRSVRLPRAERIPLGRKVVVLPERCRDEAGGYDLVVHFHGAPVTVEPAFAHSGVTAVFVSVNLGIGSGPYEQAFVSDGSLSRLLAEIDQVVQKHCPMPGGARRRLALSAWSAGYGAVYRVLASKHDRELVDAVLLADGLHAGFLDKYRQKMNELQMAPFTEFAELAVAGKKLFAITHTEIRTPSYASTSETADYLVKKEGLASESLSEPGPRDHMRLTSRAERAGFHVFGYSGGDTDAHCDHLYAIGDTLFPILKRRWADR
jgi:hypothetical protein